jgi:chloride channel 3/4/5
MNSRTSSISVPITRAQQRPSFSSRLSFAISNAEQGEAGHGPIGAENQIDEEIDEIKRYEVIRLQFFVFQRTLINMEYRISPP